MFLKEASYAHLHLFNQKYSKTVILWNIIILFYFNVIEIIIYMLILLLLFFALL